MTRERACRRLVSFLLLVALTAGCEKAKLDVSEGMGSSPTLPAANRTMFPTMNVARAVGWPQDAKPVAAPGMSVAAFARGLEHPRWLYVLPNGDVLVAESNAPTLAFRGIRGLLAKWAAKRAGAAVPSANRITLLRDTDHDGVADVRTVFLSNLYSPFGMALVGNDFYVANADALLRFPYREGDNRFRQRASRSRTCPPVSTTTGPRMSSRITTAASST
jgi:glucose/arabinose dehydrogenase